MRRMSFSHDQFEPPPQRWHEACDEPRPGAEIEADFGDGAIWCGIRYVAKVEAFVDAESGAPVRVVMWRYAH